MYAAQFYVHAQYKYVYTTCSHVYAYASLGLCNYTCISFFLGMIYSLIYSLHHPWAVMSSTVCVYIAQNAHNDIMHNASSVHLFVLHKIPPLTCIGTHFSSCHVCSSTSPFGCDDASILDCQALIWNMFSIILLPISSLYLVSQSAQWTESCH